jgi:WhiB family redox-sensing transcriptional regulator
MEVPMKDLYDATEPLLAVPITDERPWAAFAACRDLNPETFFPMTREGERAAIRICHGCPVRLECLEYAVEARIRFGVWGGMTEKQQRALHHRIA